VSLWVRIFLNHNTRQSIAHAIMTQHDFDSSLPRCTWCGTDPLYVDYHDNEWGRPVHDDRQLFEMLTLEGAQAGLSWITILRKREGYREAFHNFDVERVSRMTEKDQERLRTNERIIRNRLKIASTVTNAQAFIQVQEEWGSFDAYLWHFVGGQPIRNEWKTLRQIPAETDVSKAISKDLKKRGFRFVGPTIVYAFMQATGMVNDHVTSCFLYGNDV